MLHGVARFAQPMVQIPQGKALRVLSILERVGADGEDEVCYALASRAVVVA